MKNKRKSMMITKKTTIKRKMKKSIKSMKRRTNTKAKLNTSH